MAARFIIGANLPENASTGLWRRVTQIRLQYTRKRVGRQVLADLEVRELVEVVLRAMRHVEELISEVETGSLAWVWEGV
jgi:hypothetical protein